MGKAAVCGFVAVVGFGILLMLLLRSVGVLVELPPLGFFLGWKEEPSKEARERRRMKDPEDQCGPGRSVDAASAIWSIANRDHFDDAHRIANRDLGQEHSRPPPSAPSFFSEQQQRNLGANANYWAEGCREKRGAQHVALGVYQMSRAVTSSSRTQPLTVPGVSFLDPFPNPGAAVREEHHQTALHGPSSATSPAQAAGVAAACWSRRGRLENPEMVGCCSASPRRHPRPFRSPSSCGEEELSSLKWGRTYLVTAL